MEKSMREKMLRIYSYLMFLFAAGDVLQMIASWVNGDLNSTALAEAHGVPRNLVLTILFIVLAIGALAFFAKLYMGVKGLNRSRGIGSGRGHITVGRIALVCCVILLGVDALDLISNVSGAGIAGWLDLAGPLANCMIAGGYLKAAKEVG
jgi:hypothetical protein